MAVMSGFRILTSKSRSLTSLNKWWRSASYSSTAVAATEEQDHSSAYLKDYADYRRSLYGQITHKALLVDAVGTLVIPSQPMAQVNSFILSFLLFQFHTLFISCFAISLLILFLFFIYFSYMSFHVPILVFNFIY